MKTTYGYLVFFTKVPKICAGERTASSTYGAGKTGSPPAED
jgi:hypothetical protein